MRLEAKGNDVGATVEREAWAMRRTTFGLKTNACAKRLNVDDFAAWLAAFWPIGLNHYKHLKSLFLAKHVLDSIEKIWNHLLSQGASPAGKWT